MRNSRSPLFFDGSNCEVILTPSEAELNNMVESARKLMAIKQNKWILDQLTVEQLRFCINEFSEEIKKRGATL